MRSKLLRMSWILLKYEYQIPFLYLILIVHLFYVSHLRSSLVGVWRTTREDHLSIRWELKGSLIHSTVHTTYWMAPSSDLGTTSPTGTVGRVSGLIISYWVLRSPCFSPWEVFNVVIVFNRPHQVLEYICFLD